MPLIPAVLFALLVALPSAAVAEMDSSIPSTTSVRLAQADDAEAPPIGEEEAEEGVEEELGEDEEATESGEEGVEDSEDFEGADGESSEEDDDTQEGDDGEEQPEVVWTGAVGAGLLALAGNTAAITTSATAAIERRSERWVFSLKAGGTYGEARPVDEPSQVLAQAASTLLRADVRLTPLLSFYLAGGADLDRVKSVEWRGTGESGFGYLIWNRMEDERQTLLLRFDAAFRYQYESRFQYFPTRENLEDVQLRAPRLALAFRSAPTETFALLQDLEVLPNIGSARFLLNSLTKLSVALHRRLALTTSLLVQYDSAPAAGREPTDLSLSVGFEVPLT